LSDTPLEPEHIPLVVPDIEPIQKPWKPRRLSQRTIDKGLERVAITIPLNSSYGPKNPEEMLSVLSQRIYAYLQEHPDTDEQVIGTLSRAALALVVLDDRCRAIRREDKAAKRVGWRMAGNT
jgi:hypothetical protein